MQEHLLSPYSSIQCTPTAEYGRDKQVFKNWDPYVNRPMNLPEALATSCDTYFYNVGNRFYEGGIGRAEPAAAVGPQVRLRGADRPRHRQRGAVVADDRADARLAQEDVQERLGQGLEPGRLDPARDRAEGRHRDAAADGALLRDDRERRQARDAVRRLGRRAAGHEPAAAGHPAAVPARPAARRRRRPGRAAGGAGRPLGGDALDERHLVRRLRLATRSRSRARRAPRRRSSTCPATRSGTSRTSRGGAATGRPTRPSSSSAP